jgi:peptidoglycan/LPS O-acetylase OafA/YrhL
MNSMGAAQFPPRLLGLQAMRGVAALMVVLYHSGTLFAVHTGEVLWGNFFRAGFAGVDIFFVLSGVVIYWIHHGDCAQPEKAKVFVVKRCVRLLPVYWVVVMLKTIKDGVVLAPGALISAVFLLPAFPYYINVAWTLSYELLFYGCFLLCIIIPSKAWCVLPLACLCLSGLIGPYFVSQNLISSEALRFVLSPHLLEFLAGVLVAWRIRSRPRMHPTVAYILSLAGLLCLLVGSILLTQTANALAATPGTAAHDLAELGPNVYVDASAYIFGFASALGIAGIMGLEINGRLAAGRWQFFVFLGDISYSLYLTHGFLLNVLLEHRVVGKWLVAQPALLVIAWVAAMGLAWLSYRCVERPAQYFGRYILRRYV